MLQLYIDWYYIKKYQNPSLSWLNYNILEVLYFKSIYASYMRTFTVCSVVSTTVTWLLLHTPGMFKLIGLPALQAIQSRQTKSPSHKKKLLLLPQNGMTNQSFINFNRVLHFNLSFKLILKVITHIFLQESLFWLKVWCLLCGAFEVRVVIPKGDS